VKRCTNGKKTEIYNKPEKIIRVSVLPKVHRWVRVGMHMWRHSSPVGLHARSVQAIRRCHFHAAVRKY